LPESGLNPKIETIAIDTLCRERNCEWPGSEEWGTTHWSSRRRPLSG
jgi:hypothetical protein